MGLDVTNRDEHRGRGRGIQIAVIAGVADIARDLKEEPTTEALRHEEFGELKQAHPRG